MKIFKLLGQLREIIDQIVFELRMKEAVSVPTPQVEQGLYELRVDWDRLRQVDHEKRLEVFRKMALELHVLLPDEIGTRLTLLQRLALERKRAITTKRLFDNQELFKFFGDGFDEFDNLDVTAIWVPRSGGLAGKPRQMQITQIVARSSDRSVISGHKVGDKENPRTIPFGELVPWTEQG